jgi:hypothetical protein
MKYKKYHHILCGIPHFCKIYVSKFYNLIVKQIYCENVGYKINHDDGLCNAFLPTFKWLYIFSLMIVDI